MKILRWLQKYDERLFAWLEGTGVKRSKNVNQTCEHSNRWTQVSQRGMDSKCPTSQVPDPWD